MREFRTDPIMDGDHILIDGDEYKAEESIGKMCYLCAFHNSNKCENIPCSGVIFKRVKKESQYRPYKDTDEMIADYKERFNVSNVPSFCMPLIWVTVKPPLRGVYLATGFRKEFVCLGELFHNTQKLFDEYIYLDGSPCGKVEE